MELGSQEFWERLRTDPALLAHEVCRIDLADLQGTLQHHAGLRAWVNAAYETARVQEERAKWALTKAEARATLRARDEPDPATGKAKTVAVVAAEVAEEPEVQACTARLLDAQQQVAALRAMAHALEDRKDMLVQLSANMRAERGEYR